ncbi:MAG: GNAT family N-acetyltransferase [Acidimicrobiia bacterium]|nr:GNAT family N-acetyltransferase [Acidimicrobiia bacterium]
MDLVLRRLRLADEEEFVSSLFAEHPYSYFEPGVDFSDYLARLDEVLEGTRLPSGHVPNTRHYGFVGGEIVGALSIRLELKGMLVTLGGHVGYQVLEPYRRCGYGTAMLRQALPICADLGLDSVLVTCDEDNIASRKIIESNGGVYEKTVHSARLRAPKLRYWIDTSTKY